MAQRVRAYVGLGANIGAPDATLARAIRALDEVEGVDVRGVSRLYVTAPVGVVDQPDFHNAVVALELPAGPDAVTGALHLLRRLKDIEARFGRLPGRRWGPRILDLDLLLYGRERIRVERSPGLDRPAAVDRHQGVERFGEAEHPADSAATERPITDDLPGPAPRLLEVPHRDVGQRLFVLAPLSDLAPRLVPPGWHETVEMARRRREMIEGPSAVRPIASWDPVARGWRPAEP